MVRAFVLQPWSSEFNPDPSTWKLFVENLLTLFLPSFHNWNMDIMVASNFMQFLWRLMPKVLAMITIIINSRSGSSRVLVVLVLGVPVLEGVAFMTRGYNWREERWFGISRFESNFYVNWPERNGCLTKELYLIYRNASTITD